MPDVTALRAAFDAQSLFASVFDFRAVSLLMPFLFFLTLIPIIPIVFNSEVLDDFMF